MTISLRPKAISFCKHKNLLIILLFLAFILLLDFLYPISLKPQSQQFAKVITAEDGTPLRAFADEQGIWCYLVELKNVSPLYIQALIHYKDRWYWCYVPLYIGLNLPKYSAVF